MDNHAWFLQFNPTEAAEAATAFAAQFNGTLVQTGDAWSLTAATYTDTPNPVVSVNLTVTLTGLSNLAAVQNVNLAISVGKATITEGELETIAIVLQPSEIDFKLSKSIDSAGLEPLEGAFINSAKLTAEAKITHKDSANNNLERAFVGRFELEAGTSAAQKALNPNHPDSAMTLLPQRLYLNGIFSQGSQHINASVTATLDANNAIKVVTGGMPTTVPVTYTLSEDSKVLTMTLVSGENRASVTATLVEPSEQNYNHQVVEIRCDSRNDAHCYSWGDHWIYDTNTSYSNVLTALDSGYMGYWGWMLQAEVRDNDYGWVKVPEEFNRSLLVNNAYSTTASADTYYVNETATHFIKGNVVVNVSGNLSPALPNTLLQLTLQRTDLHKGTAELLVKWQAQTTVRKVITISAALDDSLHGNTNDKLMVTIKDTAGTELRISEDSLTDGMAITKDGTRYAVITKEQGVYWVTYLFDDAGTPKIDRKEFESLF